MCITAARSMQHNAWWHSGALFPHGLPCPVRQYLAYLATSMRSEPWYHPHLKPAAPMGKLMAMSSIKPLVSHPLWGS